MLSARKNFSSSILVRTRNFFRSRPHRRPCLQLVAMRREASPSRVEERLMSCSSRHRNDSIARAVERPISRSHEDRWKHRSLLVAMHRSCALQRLMNDRATACPRQSLASRASLPAAGTCFASRRVLLHRHKLFFFNQLRNEGRSAIAIATRPDFLTCDRASDEACARCSQRSESLPRTSRADGRRWLAFDILARPCSLRGRRLQDRAHDADFHDIEESTRIDCERPSRDALESMA